MTDQFTHIRSIFGFDKLSDLQKIFNPSAAYEKYYVLLDSKNRINDSDGKRMKWHYSSSNSFQTGAVTTNGRIRNIIGMRLYPIRITPNYDISQQKNSLYSLLIEEFSMQSFSGFNRNFHFMLKKTPYFDVLSSQVTIQASELTPLNNGWFWFNRPITEVNSFTLSLGNPLEPINIPVAEILLRLDRITIGPTTVFNCDRSHGFTTGDIIRITGFTTNDPITDSVVIEDVNDVAGHAITVIDLTSFSIAVDTSTVTPTTIGNILIANESIRVIIHIEFICYADDQKI